MTSKIEFGGYGNQFPRAWVLKWYPHLVKLSKVAEGVTEKWLIFPGGTEINRTNAHFALWKSFRDFPTIFRFVYKTLPSMYYSLQGGKKKVGFIRLLFGNLNHENDPFCFGLFLLTSQIIWAPCIQQPKLSLIMRF